MDLWTDSSQVPKGFGPSAVTVGKFDGVHLGHRAVLAKLGACAAQRALVPTVVTFDRNPLSLIRPSACPEPLMSNRQKLEQLADAGVAATLMLSFTEALRDLAAEEFVRHILIGALRARAILVGADFRFGARGSGDISLLRGLASEGGFEVIDIVNVTPVGDRRASSTWVRELLIEGRVREAAQLLGALPSVRSVVVHGEHRGRELGYPTANLSPDSEGFIPADGVYAAWLSVAGVAYPAAVSVGNNPTFEGIPEKRVEAYALDKSFDIYGETVEVRFVDYIRGMGKFDTVAELVTRMAADVERTREILGGHSRAAQ